MAVPVRDASSGNGDGGGGVSTRNGVEAAELVKTYSDGTMALAGISFAAEAGEIFGLLGPNGSGKTTSVRIFVTLLQPTSGLARVAGLDVVGNRPAIRERIGYAGQYVGVDSDLTATENLVMSARLHGVAPTDASRRTEVLTETFGLGGVAHQRAGRLSGGMRRRLDLAQAMVHRPQVLFLDEPTTGLDPQARNALWDQLRALADDGTTILLTTQYLEEADRLCRRVAILDAGGIVTSGTPTALKEAAGADRVTLTLEEPAGLEQHARTWRVAAEVPGVLHVSENDGAVEIRMRRTDDTLFELVRRLDREGIGVSHVQLVPTTLDDVFVAYTGSTPRSETENSHRSTSVFAAIHGGGQR
jgi:ABC-2 type transport system ATP-binding protein